MNPQKLLKEIERTEKETVRVLKKSISFNTVNPPGNEFLVADWLEQRFSKKGIKTKKFEKLKGRTNLIAWVGKGKPELMIVAHSDVVPEGTGWKTKPFVGTEKKGRVYGRGSADNKGPLASGITFLELMKKHESELNGKISLFVAADEEKGSELGAEYMIKEKKINPDYVIVPDVLTENREISVGEKGLLHLKATANGKQAHASEPWRGENAIEKMISFLAELKKWKKPVKTQKYFSKTTMNIGVINGGNAPNTVPNECTAMIDLRYPPNIKFSELTAPIKKIAKRNGVKIEVSEHQKPFVIKTSLPLFKSVKKHTKTITGRNPKITSMPGTTICKKFVLNGKPAVGFGPGKMVAHISNEFIDVYQLTEFSKIMALVCLDLIV